MYIPHHFKTKKGQFFIIGLVVGAVIAYLLFTFMYGKMYEQLVEVNRALTTEVTELTEQNKALLKDKEDISEQSEEPITVQSVHLSFQNPSELKLDRLMVHQFDEILLKEISHIIGQNIVTLSENDQLLISTIENKSITLDDLTYSFEVSRLIIAQKVKITLDVKLE